jgi:hypothetical protein
VGNSSVPFGLPQPLATITSVAAKTCSQPFGNAAAIRGLWYLLGVIICYRVKTRKMAAPAYSIKFLPLASLLLIINLITGAGIFRWIF